MKHIILTLALACLSLACLSSGLAFAEESPPFPPLVENILQIVNESEQTQKPTAIQSETLPLDTQKIRDIVAETPDAERWGGYYETGDKTVYFGIALVRVPKTNLNRDIRTMLGNRALLLAQNETALARAEDNFLAAGLFDDTVLLKQAYRSALSQYALKGTYKKQAEFTFDAGETIAGVVTVLKDNFEVTVDASMENLVLKSYIGLLQQKLKERQPVP